MMNRPPKFKVGWFWIPSMDFNHGNPSGSYPPQSYVYPRKSGVNKAPY